MARRGFSDSGLTELANAYVVFMCNGTDKQIEQQLKPQINDKNKIEFTNFLTSGVTLASSIKKKIKEKNGESHHIPINEVKKSPHGTYDHNSFKVLFTSHRELSGLHHGNPIDPDNINLGGFKSLLSIIEIVGDNILNVKNKTNAKPAGESSIAAASEEALTRAIYQYKIARVGNKNLTDIIPPKELYKLIASTLGVTQSEHDKNPVQYNKVRMNFLDSVEKTKFSPTTYLMENLGINRALSLLQNSTVGKIIQEFQGPPNLR